MRYALPANLFFCLTEGRAVFLDLAHNRYFRLSAAQDALFQTLLSDSQVAEPHVASLVRLGVVRPASAGEGLAPSRVAIASRSALEAEDLRSPPGRRMMLSVAYAVGLTWLSLKLLPIDRVVDRLRRTRARTRAECRKAPASEILAVALQFNRARRAVPIDTVCLLDSLALVAFLGRRGLFAHLIMGVKLNPFAAHCWVQHQDIILNDAFDRASAFTPILVV